MEFGKLGIERVNGQEVNEIKEAIEEISNVSDYEAVLDEIMESLEGRDFQIPSEEEVSEMAEFLGISGQDLQKLVDFVADPRSALEDVIMQDVKPNDNYLAYCTFAGCQGTCRGCAGRH